MDTGPLDYDGVDLLTLLPVKSWMDNSTGDSVPTLTTITGVARPLESSAEQAWMVRNFAESDRTGYYLPLIVMADAGTVLRWTTQGGQTKTLKIPAQQYNNVVLPLSPNGSGSTVFNIYHPDDTAMVGTTTYKVDYQDMICPITMSDKGKHYAFVTNPPNKHMTVGQVYELKVAIMENGTLIQNRDHVWAFTTVGGGIELIDDASFKIRAKTSSLGYGYIVLMGKDPLDRTKFDYLKIDVS